ncbi:MAG: exo-alpha-sialidase [Clostridia bacterium]|nr:exo-alpha-sialidase [Clostridia bacterium]
MKIHDIRVICQNEGSVFSYFGWPSVARLDDGTLAMACSGYRMRHVCPFGKAVISYSRDGGMTWTRPTPVIDTYLDDRDSGIVLIGNGRAIFTSFNNTVAQQRVWAQKLGEDTPEQRASKAFTLAYLDLLDTVPDAEKQLGSTYAISDDGGYTFGEVRFTDISTPHGPMTTRSGEVLYIGSNYARDYAKNELNRTQVACYRLNDKDAFEFVSGIPDIPNPESGLYFACEPHAIELKSGKILVHIRVQGGVFTVYQSESYDGGKTFTQPHRLLSEHGGSPAHLLEHSSGRIVSVYGYRNAPYGIRYMTSDDEGASWDTDNILYDGGESADLGYPASVELADGRILTVYYEKENGTSHIKQIIWSLDE